MSTALQIDRDDRSEPLRLLADADRRFAAGDARGALALFTTACTGPYAAYAELRRGQIMHAQRDLGAAYAALLRAASLKPGDAPILFALAAVARDRGDVDEAEAALRAAIRARPDAPEPAAALAKLLHKTGRTAEARALVDAARRRCPPSLPLIEQDGLLALASNDPRHAEIAFRAALHLAPDMATHLVNLAEALADQQRWDESLALLDRAIPALQEPAQARLNRAYALFELGRWGEGWHAYEHRFARASTAHAPRRPEHFALPCWRGEALDGALFVWSEQGLGDEILAGALLPMLTARAIDIVFECEPRLAPLFARSFPGMRIVARGDGRAVPPRDCVAQIAAGSLFGLLGWTPATARPAAYLNADPARVASARTRLRRDGQRLIGLSWSSRNPQLGALKSLPLSALETLLRAARADMLDLQYGDSDAMRAALASATGVWILRDAEIDVAQDIDGLAALIGACDVVVTASNVTAHVAGALGVETHVLVPHGRARLWYWLGAGAASPFYPRTSIHRQAPDGGWDQALASVSAALTRPIR